MPRKAYLADLSAALQIGVFGSNIENVRPGNDDGEFLFTFNLASNKPRVDISALVPDVSAYPSSHDYHVFAGEDAPALVANALQELPDLHGKPIATALTTLSRFLADRTRTGGQNDPFDIDSDTDTDLHGLHYDVDVDSDLDMNGENEDWALDDALDGGSSYAHPSRHTETVVLHRVNEDYVTRARADLRAAKAAGLKVGILGSLQTGSGCYLSISCRIAKLGISEEAMAAWSIHPEQYLVLLLHYKVGYKPLDFLQDLDSFSARHYVEMRTGICDSYKPPTMFEAQQAFKQSTTEATDPEDRQSDRSDNTGFRQSFISRPLDELLNSRLITIVKYRLSMGLGWSGAELFFNDSQAQLRASSDHIDPKYMVSDDNSSHLPSIVKADEIGSRRATLELSFPLIAVQFLLRHFVLAPQFCLVCHCKLEDQLEAIKPYVCEKGLCLYQYMSLGFGPEIEHELKSQPYVVDLLISFCYSSVTSQALHNFPEGLGLQVPHPDRPLEQWAASSSALSQGSWRTVINNPARATSNTAPPSTPTKPSDSMKEDGTYRARLNQSTRELLFDLTEHRRCPLRKGDWVAMNCAGTPAWHCRVIETSLFPTVAVAEPLQIDPNKKAGRQIRAEVVPVRANSWQAIECIVYSQNFDELEIRDKYRSMELLLDLLPSVIEMREYLCKKPGSSLANWIDRISPAALGVLRWIIASNRSCIMQVDQPEFQGEGRVAEERVQGVPKWLQFRFAMGAPDKEKRFVDAIKAEMGTSTHPTLFAWHGSRLCNWHNIIRESLNFDKTVNGRAYGHGCYFAKDFHTSSGYASMYRGVGGGESGVNVEAWPHSILQISAALALTEIVNSPGKFVSQSPYYVVAQLEWIQTRYLFIQPCAKIVMAETTVSTALSQDPTRTPTGCDGTQLVLPLTAIPKSRRPISRSGTAEPPRKRNKLTADALSRVDGDTAMAVPDPDAVSVVTDVADVEILFAPDSRPVLPMMPTKAKPKKAPAMAVTPFKITTINDLPTMQPPSYATNAATKRLQKDFRSLLATQESHISADTLADLGWYVDPEHVSRTDNLYQWVVELHSFPLSLPLAVDLNAKSIQSVVLEIRFHATYPMSPPFVRVVRPRFLPFMSGGGGHVTAGGSICMDLLTNSGWTAVSDIESVLLQIRMAIMSTDPRPARLEQHGRGGTGYGDYGVGEAVEAFKRACLSHGWVVPEGLNEVAFGN